MESHQEKIEILQKELEKLSKSQVETIPENSPLRKLAKYLNKEYANILRIKNDNEQYKKYREFTQKYQKEIWVLDDLPSQVFYSDEFYSSYPSLARYLYDRRPFHEGCEYCAADTQEDTEEDPSKR